MPGVVRGLRPRPAPSGPKAPPTRARRDLSEGVEGVVARAPSLVAFSSAAAPVFGGASGEKNG